MRRGCERAKQPRRSQDLGQEFTSEQMLGLLRAELFMFRPKIRTADKEKFSSSSNPFGAKSAAKWHLSRTMPLTFPLDLDRFRE